MKGKDVSRALMSNTQRGHQYVPYLISYGNSATLMHGIIMVSKAMIATHGDPDGEALTLTMT
jgi:hypothetical protein